MLQCDIFSSTVIYFKGSLIKTHLCQHQTPQAS
jgi:hypothetical protein